MIPDAAGPAASGANILEVCGATASVCAMALSLMLINALGTLVLFLAASLSILLRIFTHRRQGGVSGVSLGAGAFLAEAGVVILIGSIARLAAGS